MAWEKGTWGTGPASADGVSWCYALWTNQYDTVKGISTTSETPVMQTTAYLLWTLWNTRLEQASGFLFIDLFVLLLLSFSEVTDFESKTHSKSLLHPEPQSDGVDIKGAAYSGELVTCTKSPQSLSSGERKSSEHRQALPLLTDQPHESWRGALLLGYLEAWTPSCHLISGNFAGPLQVVRKTQEWCFVPMLLWEWAWQGGNMWMAFWRSSYFCPQGCSNSQSE